MHFVLQFENGFPQRTKAKVSSQMEKSIVDERMSLVDQPYSYKRYLISKFDNRLIFTSPF